MKSDDVYLRGYIKDICKFDILSEKYAILSKVKELIIPPEHIDSVHRTYTELRKKIIDSDKASSENIKFRSEKLIKKFYSYQDTIRVINLLDFYRDASFSMINHKFTDQYTAILIFINFIFEPKIDDYIEKRKFLRKKWEKILKEYEQEP
jgi:hypothetical protein